MKEIKMKNGMVAKVDDGDYDDLSKYKWHAVKNGPHWYARTNLFIRCKSHPLPMHRILLNLCNPSDVGDHIDGDTLNNQRSNLRKCSPKENSRNLRKLAVTSKGVRTSIYKGVCFKKANQKYYATIDVDRKKIHLGVFTDERIAAVAYNKAAIKYHGEFARLNKI
jgi:hypothetical protein